MISIFRDYTKWLVCRIETSKTSASDVMKINQMVDTFITSCEGNMTKIKTRINLLEERLMDRNITVSDIETKRHVLNCLITISGIVIGEDNICIAFARLHVKDPPPKVKPFVFEFAIMMLVKRICASLGCDSYPSALCFDFTFAHMHSLNVFLISLMRIANSTFNAETPLKTSLFDIIKNTTSSPNLEIRRSTILLVKEFRFLSKTREFTQICPFVFFILEQIMTVFETYHGEKLWSAVIEMVHLQLNICKISTANMHFTYFMFTRVLKMLNNNQSVSINDDDYVTLREKYMPGFRGVVITKEPNPNPDGMLSSQFQDEKLRLEAMLRTLETLKVYVPISTVISLIGKQLDPDTDPCVLMCYIKLAKDAVITAFTSMERLYLGRVGFQKYLQEYEQHVYVGASLDPENLPIVTVADTYFSDKSIFPFILPQKRKKLRIGRFGMIGDIFPTQHK